VTSPRTGQALAAGHTLEPTRVKRLGTARETYGISPSLLDWRDKRTEGCCRMCRRPAQVRPLTQHHIVPQAYFRQRKRLLPVRNVSANRVPLCRPCHDLVEQDETARRELRRLLAPDEITYVIQTAGRRWLDERYPAAPPYGG
jgi:5-methylcytosine-specific restriction endonuclease McrA